MTEPSIPEREVSDEEVFAALDAHKLLRTPHAFNDMKRTLEQFVSSRLAAPTGEVRPAPLLELVEALRLARDYVESASTEMYDGTNGHGIRKEASRRLALIDAALSRPLAAPLPAAEELASKIEATCAGESVWYAMNTDESAYCMRFDSSDNLSPERACQEWFEQMRRERPTWLAQNGYHAVQKRDYTRAEKLALAAVPYLRAASPLAAPLPAEPASPVAEESRGSRLQQQGGRMADLGTLPRYGSRHHNCITFAELVEHGRKSGANIVNGVPWHFHFNGAPVTHENDECYLVMGKHGDVRFTSGDLLFTDEIGAFYTSPISDYVAFLEVARYGKVAPVACHTSAWVGWRSATSTTPPARTSP